MTSECPDESVRVATACELGAAPLDRPFGLADGQIRAGKTPSRPNGTSSRPVPHHRLAGVAVADSRLDPSGVEAQRRHHVQEREPGVVDGAGGFDELFGPGIGS